LRAILHSAWVGEFAALANQATLRIILQARKQ